MKSGRLQAFSYCPTCANIRAIQGGMITYFPESTRIEGLCASCGAPLTIVGQRHAALKIRSDKRRWN
ncbi:MAG TPA: hypothetical protein VKX96_12720 [Chloroflexota bacterium]|jgi:hypothetical protein|nr:hypothetical protein [Chloroflexota bacterium]